MALAAITVAGVVIFTHRHDHRAVRPHALIVPFKASRST
jgi:hypothetical protein